MSDPHGPGDHHHDDFDPEPAQALSPGEPRTPASIPILGACIFLLGTVVFLVRFSDPRTAQASASASGAAAAGSAPVAQAPAAPPKPARKAPPQDASSRREALDKINRNRPRPSGAPTAGTAPSGAPIVAPVGTASAGASPRVPPRPPRPAPVNP